LIKLAPFTLLVLLTAFHPLSLAGLRVLEIPTILVYYYVWYVDGLGGPHWNDSDLTKVIDVPAIGFYDSYNDSVIRWQLSLMKRAGVDGVIISWWGPGSYEDRVAKKVFRYLKLFGLKGCIMIEPFLTSDLGEARKVYNESFWSRILDYVYRNFVEPYRGTYLEIDGKPLVLAFAPVGIFYRPRSERFLIRVVATMVDEINALSSLTGMRVDWDLWPWYIPLEKGFHGLRLRVGGYVALAPRYDPALERLEGVADRDPLDMDPSYSQRVYDEEWKWVLNHFWLVRIVAIYSWNEYHERSEIEPHRDATASNGAYPYEATLRYAHELKNLVKEFNEAIAILVTTLLTTLFLAPCVGLELSRVLRPFGKGLNEALNPLERLDNVVLLRRYPRWG